MEGGNTLGQQLRTNLLQIQQDLEAIQLIDSLLEIANAADSTNLIAQKTILIGALESLSSANEALSLQLQADCQINAPYVQSMNNGIQTNMDIQECEQNVNDIYLETNAIGELMPSSLDIVTLQDIANLCPLAAGQSVYKARALLALIEGPKLYYDSLICANYTPPTNKIAMPGIAMNNIAVASHIYPNPNKGSFILTIRQEKFSKGEVIIFDGLGRKLRKIAIEPGQARKTIDLYDQQSGIFWAKLYLDDEEVAIHKIILVK